MARCTRDPYATSVWLPFDACWGALMQLCPPCNQQRSFLEACWVGNIGFDCSVKEHCQYSVAWVAPAVGPAAELDQAQSLVRPTEDCMCSKRLSAKALRDGHSIRVAVCQVYKARRKFTGRTVAIKVINKVGKPQKEIDSLRQELLILKTLKHPNIVEMLESLETEREFCVVMEYALGTRPKDCSMHPGDHC